MSDLMFFDCHATVGQRQMKPVRARWTTEQLLEDMDLAEVAGSKFDFDAVGHYARPDVFQLVIHEQPGPR